MTNRKISSYTFAALPVKDSSFSESFLSLRTHGVFYGTNPGNEREGYFKTVQTALAERIKDPITNWCRDPKSCFFKPYQNTAEGFDGFINGVGNPLIAVLCGLGYLVAWAAHPVVIIALFCTPALFELGAACIGIAQSAWHLMKYCYNQNPDVQNEAASYFLDAMTRPALVLPLAVVSLVSAPFELVRFVTRLLSTAIDYFSQPVDEIEQEFKKEHSDSISLTQH